MNNKYLSSFNILAAFTAALFISIILFSISVIFDKCTQEEKTLDNKKNTEVIKTITTKQNESNKRKPIADLNQQAQTFDYLGQKFSAFIFDAAKQQINFSFQTKAGKNYGFIDKVTHTLEETGNTVLFAMNAGIFTTEKKPEGLFIANGETLATINLKKGNGNFYLKPNGVFFLTKEGKMGILASKNFAQKDLDIEYATQSGPLLLRTDTIHKALNQGSPNLRVRNGVGIISPTKAVFVISEEPVNFYDFTMVFKEYYGCRDALYLDGVISEMYLPELGKTEVNREFVGIISVTD